MNIKLILLLFVLIFILHISFSVPVTGQQFNYNQYRAVPITESQFFKYGMPFSNNKDNIYDLQNNYIGDFGNNQELSDICKNVTIGYVINGYSIVKVNNYFDIYSLTNCKYKGRITINNGINDWIALWHPINGINTPLLYVMDNLGNIYMYKLSDMSLYRETQSILFNKYYSDMFRAKIEFNVTNNTGYYLVILNTKDLIDRGYMNYDGSQMLFVDDDSRQLLDWYVVPGTWDTNNTQIVVKLLPTTKEFGLYFKYNNSVIFSFYHSFEGFHNIDEGYKYFNDNGYATYYGSMYKFSNLTIIKFNYTSGGYQALIIPLSKNNPIVNHFSDMLMLLDYDKLVNGIPLNNGYKLSGLRYYTFDTYDKVYLIIPLTGLDISNGQHRVYIFWNNSNYHSNNWNDGNYNFANTIQFSINKEVSNDDKSYYFNSFNYNRSHYYFIYLNGYSDVDVNSYYYNHIVNLYSYFPLDKIYTELNVAGAYGSYGTISSRTIYLNINGNNMKLHDQQGSGTGYAHLRSGNIVMYLHNNSMLYNINYNVMSIDKNYTVGNVPNNMQFKFRLKSDYQYDSAIVNYNVLMFDFDNVPNYTEEYSGANFYHSIILYNNYISINYDKMKYLSYSLDNATDFNYISFYLYNNNSVIRYRYDHNMNDTINKSNFEGSIPDGHITGMYMIIDAKYVSLKNIKFVENYNYFNYYQQLQHGFGITAYEYNGNTLNKTEIINNVDLSWNKSIDGFNNLLLKGYFYPKDGPGTYTLNITNVGTNDTVLVSGSKIKLRYGLNELKLNTNNWIGVYCNGHKLNYTYVSYGNYFLINNTIGDNITCTLYFGNENTYEQTKVFSNNGIYLVTRHNTWTNHPNNHDQLMQLYNQSDYEYGHGIVTQIYQNNNPYGSDDHYTDHYSSYFYADKSGKWCFATDSDDASEIQVDGNVVVGWYGGHGVANNWDHNACINLNIGWHKIDYYHEEITGDQAQRMAISYGGTSNWKVYSTSNFYITHSITGNYNNTEIKNNITISQNGYELVPIDIYYIDNGDGQGSLKIDVYKDGNYIGTLNSTYTIPDKSNTTSISNIDLDFSVGDFNGDGVDDLAYITSDSIYIFNLENVELYGKYNYKNIICGSSSCNPEFKFINDNRFVFYYYSGNTNYYADIVLHKNNTFSKHVYVAYGKYFFNLRNSVTITCNAGVDSGTHCNVINPNNIQGLNLGCIYRYPYIFYYLGNGSFIYSSYDITNNGNEYFMCLLKDYGKESYSKDISYNLYLGLMYNGAVFDVEHNRYFVSYSGYGTGWFGTDLNLHKVSDEVGHMLIGKFSGDNKEYLYINDKQIDLDDFNKQYTTSLSNSIISNARLIDADMDGYVDLVSNGHVYTTINANSIIHSVLYRQQHNVMVGENVPIVADVIYYNTYHNHILDSGSYFSTLYLPDIINSSTPTVIKQNNYNVTSQLNKIINNTMFYRPDINPDEIAEFLVFYYAKPVHMVDSYVVNNNTYILYMNFTGPKEINYIGIIADVPVPETIYYPHLFYYYDGAWVDVTNNPSYNFQAIDDNNNGLIDHIKFILPIVNANKVDRYMLRAVYSNPVICNVTHKQLINSPITASQYAYWNWTVVCHNPNNFNIRFDSKIRLPLKSSEIMLDGNVTNTKLESNGYYVHIVGYINANSNQTHYITFKTPPITVIPTYYYPTKYYIDHKANVVMKLDVRNWATEPLPNVHVSLPIVYGQNIKVYNNNGDLIDSMNQVSGILDFVIPVIKSQEAQTYTINYTIPVGESSEPHGVTTTIINGTQYLIKYVKIHSTTPVPLNDNVYYIDKVPCNNVSKVIEVTSFGNEFGNQLSYSCNGTKTVINLGSLDVGQDKYIEIFYTGTPPIEKIQPISNATQSISHSIHSILTPYNNFWKNIFTNELHMEYGPIQKAIAYGTPILLLWIILRRIW